MSLGTKVFGRDMKKFGSMTHPAVLLAGHSTKCGPRCSPTVAAAAMAAVVARAAALGPRGMKFSLLQLQA